jgi:hypothetical protein
MNEETKPKGYDLDFGQAIRFLKGGSKVARAGWNGKSMFLIYVPSFDWTIADGLLAGESSLSFGNWIGMKTADNKFIPWLASQTDMLADDWQVIA